MVKRRLEKMWYKLTNEQIKNFGLSTYEGEVVLHDGSGICNADTLYVNAQDFFDDSYLISLKYWEGNK